MAGLVVPNHAKKMELWNLAYALDQAMQQLIIPRTTEQEKAEAKRQITATLGQISQFIDANPTLRLDNSTHPDFPDEDDTLPLATTVAVSTDPASVPVYYKMLERQPDILKKRISHDMTPEEHIAQVIEYGNLDAAARAVLQEKLNPGRKEMAKMDRLFGNVGKEREASPLPRGVQTLIREQLTGLTPSEQVKSATKKGGRKTRRVRKTRKTKTRSRKTK